MMLVIPLFVYTLVVSLALAQNACNPLVTQKCPPIAGLPTSTFTVDFTQQTSLPQGWVLDNWANVTFTSEGAKYFFERQGNAPYMWTDFYVAFGRVDVELRVAKGTGIITSSVMFADTQDEIDWEFSGSNFAQSSGSAFTNYFGKGVTGNYDRGTLESVENPQDEFHTYSFDWQPDRLQWLIDGNVVRTLENSGAITGDHQYPQTPSRLHVGLWDAGSPSTAQGTVLWAGGYTNYTQVPFWATMRRMKITTPYPCQSWEYPENFSGQWKDVKCINNTTTTTTPTTTTSTTAPKTTSTSTIPSSTSSNAVAMTQSTAIGVTALPNTGSSAISESSLISAPSSLVTLSTTTSTATTSTTGTSSSSNVIVPGSTQTLQPVSPYTLKETFSNIPEGWSYKGCWTDPATIWQRALNVSSGVRWLDVTNERCVKSCGAQGYSFAGTEYWWECWCGNLLFNSTERPESECSKRCIKNGREVCGGDYRLTVFAKDGYWRQWDGIVASAPTSSSTSSLPSTMTSSSASTTSTTIQPKASPILNPVTIKGPPILAGLARDGYSNNGGRRSRFDKEVIAGREEK